MKNSSETSRATTKLAICSQLAKATAYLERGEVIRCANILYSELARLENMADLSSDKMEASFK